MGDLDRGELIAAEKGYISLPFTPNRSKKT